METSHNIVDLTPENFQQLLVEESKTKLVVVDFWADWCEPCKTLMPMLEKIASEYSEEMILAKVNSDEQQQIAMQFGVRSLPTVMLVKNGQPVDGFAGVQPESEIRAKLAQHLPRPEDKYLDQAKSFMQKSQWADAFSAISKAYDLDKERIDIKKVLVSTQLELGKLDDADSLLSTFGLADQDADFHGLQSKLELMQQASETPEIKALQQQLIENPYDLDIKTRLAVQLSQANKSEDALTLMLEVLKKDVNFGDAKKLALDIISTLPAGDPLASKFRSQIFTLMY